MRFIAPWPPRELSPNARCHWAVKSAAVKAYRHRVCTEAIVAGARRMTGPFSVRLIFCPIGRGPNPDLDNVIASFKAGQDGLADALRVNDRELVVTHEMGDRCKSGSVIVEVIGK